MIFKVIASGIGAVISPRSALSARSMPLLPLAGYCVIAFIVLFFNSFRITNPSAILILFYGLSIVGYFRIVRIKTMLDKHSIKFTRNEWLVVIAIFILCLPILSHLMTTAFDTNDEIYSWNYWARQFYVGDEISFYFTQAPYPQLFSAFLGGAYFLVGSLDLQTSVKLSLGILPIASLLMILFSIHHKEIGVGSFVLAAVVLFGLDMDDNFKYALADPMMSTFLVASLYTLFNADKFKTISVKEALYLSVLFMAAASITKQAAIFWAVFTYPVAYYIQWSRLYKPARLSWLSVLPLLTALIWLLSQGRGFQNNQGVIDASLKGRGLLEQLTKSFEIYFLNKPILLILFVVFSFWVLKSKDRLALWVYFSVIVSLVLWLLFGAYEFRLGMHIFLILPLLFFAYGDFRFPSFNLFIKKSRFKVIAITALFGLMTILSVAQAMKVYEKNRDKYNHRSLDQGFGLQAIRLVGADGAKLVESLKDQPHKVLSSTNYQYGFLFKYLNLAKLDYKAEKVAAISAKSLRVDGVTHLFMSNQRLAYGPLNSHLLSLVARCPSAFENVTIKENYSGLKVYKVLKGECSK